METCMTMFIAVLLLSLWLLIGNHGFLIWRKKIFELYKPKLATDCVMLNMKLLSCKNRFRLAGLAGLIYALNYRKNIRGLN